MIGLMSLAELQREMPSTLNAVAFGGDVNFSSVSTDSRKISSGELFVALRGDNFNAHEFMGDVFNSGAVGAIVEVLDPQSQMPQLQVSDTTLALGQIGKINRENFFGYMLAITGSSGKTTVRTMVDSILQQEGCVLSTNGNFNNHIGLPLTLLRLNGTEQFAVVEMGASAIGEIAYLCELAQPDVVLVNNVLPAHLEGFGSLEGIAQAKGEIYQGVKPGGCSVVNLDDDFSPQWLSQVHSNTAITYSIQNENANCYARNIVACSGGVSFDLHLAGQHTSVNLMAYGVHNVSNALAAACCAHAVNISIEKISKGLEAFSPVAGRMKTYPNIRNQITLIDDSYNANPGSVRVAIDVLSDMEMPGVLVMGDMGELGDDAHLLHARLGSYASTKNIEAVLTVGHLSRAIGENFVGVSRHFDNQLLLIDYLKHKVSRNRCAVLIKGSRSARMDKVVQALINEKVH